MVDSHHIEIGETREGQGQKGSSFINEGRNKHAYRK